MPITAVFYSMLATCLANDVNPYEYLTDVLRRINDHPVNRIEELAPCNWKPSGVAGVGIDRSVDVVLAGCGLGDPALNRARASGGTKR